MSTPDTLVPSLKQKRTLNPKMQERVAFNKSHYDEVRHLPVRERFGALAKMFAASK